ncbi:MAG: xanthine dehydrogenase family protein molybdopterin-binding subunit [Planctomycetales bacterium]|nr:xanthine dehydrogenase family protein molybdopterin-binding subunit [Planctomycetales bacterium]
MSNQSREFDVSSLREESPAEFERYEFREPPRYVFAADRREFVGALGAGLVILVSPQGAQAQREGRQARREERLADRLHVGVDGVVTVFTSKVEVGQGARTQITQAAAEELRLPMEQIRLVMADTASCPDDGGTAGSRTTPSTIPRVRNACAAARARLVEFAAAKLHAETSEVQYDGGAFSVPSGAATTLGDLAADRKLIEALQAPPAADVEIRSVDSWQVLGAPAPKVGAVAIVTGRHRYPSDVQVQGMVYGKVLRPASYGATLKDADLAPAKAMDGVTAVRDGNFVGCTAPTSWRAAQAVEAIAATATWDRPPHLHSDRLYEHLQNTAKAEGGGRRGEGRQWGDWQAALAAARKRLQSTYRVAYIQHAPMEPRAAVAQWQDGRLTVWTGTQQPARVHSELQNAFRLEATDVRVIVPDTGGGFGGKHTGEAAVEAARLAKAAGKPTSLRWTREEEFTWAYFRPAGVIEIDAALDESGRLTAWDVTNINSGGSAIDSPYQSASGRTRVLAADAPLRQGSYRALASTANNFAREAAMDELAELANVDPLDFRLAHLGPGRLRDVLVAATDRFDWRSRRAAGRSAGVACGTEKGSFVAACVEAAVVNNTIRVTSICQAYECGAIQNPKNLLSQVQGCIMMGLGGALREEIRFADGQIVNPSFSSYQVPRMDDLPDLDVVLLNRQDLPSVGAGETPIIAVAPALAGAVFAATGKRRRSLPLQI